MTSRKSSGSIRAESAVEPTRSENITVTWRRSAMFGVFGSINAGCGDTGTALASSAIASQQLLAMAERHDADVLEIVVGQPTQHLDVDVVGAEQLGMLA